MAPPPTSLRAFLATARKALTAPPGQRQAPLTFVIGNESADLDSLCSALLYAYLRTHNTPHYTLHIPLSNLVRADLSTHTEFVAVLKHAGLQEEDMLTLSELPTRQDLDPEQTRWILVDHNALTGGLEEPYTPRVVGCVDHHVDENKVPQETGEEPRVLQKTGSCMSLVVEYCKDAWQKIPAGARGEGSDGEVDINTQLARVALAPILIDTTNLTSKDKVTDTDVRAVDFAESRLAGQSGYDRKEYFDEITKVKEDLSRLSYREIFRKDYKQWTDGGLVLGVSSIVQGFSYLLERIGDEKVLLKEFRKYAEEEGLDLAAIMTTSHVGAFKRELLVWALNEDAAQAAKAFVMKNHEELQLEPWDGGKLDGNEGAGWRACWVQHQLKDSRKQVAPMLRAAMKENAKL